jgi:urease accessory protein
MGWHAWLQLRYGRDGDRTISHDLHRGPLRVLQRLYPEGPGICHHVLVHPPGGVVGGDVLEVEATLDAGTHALITTPGATRFYRSAGAGARQQVTLALAAGARLEWLPLETIAHRGCIAESVLRLSLQPGAEAMGWDVLALGLPAAGEPFDQGRFQQHIEIPGVWLERGLIDAADRELLDGAPGLAGRCVLATLWFAAGASLASGRRDALLDGAREVLAPAGFGAVAAGVSAPQAPLVVLRALADRVEPAMVLLQRVRAAWRRSAWQLEDHPPRIWRT